MQAHYVAVALFCVCWWGLKLSCSREALAHETVTRLKLLSAACIWAARHCCHVATQALKYAAARQ